MGFNSLISSELNHQGTRSASDKSSIVLHLNPNFDTVSGARMAERTRIAQELHDTLLQGLFAVSMQLRSAVDTLPTDSEAEQRFSGLADLFDRVVEQGRFAVQGLRSPDNHILSLGQAFASVPTELGLTSAGSGFRVVVEGKQRALKTPLRDEVYRIGCEAIFNAYRHSRAKEIETQIQYRPAGLRVAVRDNGCGIDPRELRWEPKGHWGLRGMRERAERIGARLRILSRVALGTEVELYVPDRVAFEQS